jgi:hypothetical protein
MNAKTHRRTLAILGCVVSLGGTALAVAPSAASAATTCPNTRVPVKHTGSRTLRYPVKAITAQGLNCAQADKLIPLILEGKTPKAWKNVPAHFKAPTGLVPQEFKASGGRILEYAVAGG